MATFVMVAGGWKGGWVYAPIARALRRDGHEVFTPTLTGLGERRHLAGTAINLDTHIADIVHVLTDEKLQDVVLCGHSYAGMVISGVADRCAERIAALVYLDAFVPQDGDAWWDLAGDAYRALAIRNSRDDGLSVTPPPGMDSRCVPHPLGSFLQRIRLTGRWRDVPRKVFVYADRWEATPFADTRRTLEGDPAWTVEVLPCGHGLMAEAPDAVREILVRAGRG